MVVRTPAGAEDLRVVAPRGRLDASLAQELASTLDQLAADGFCRFIIDLRHATYISSSGLRVLLVALRKARAHSGDVKLYGLKPQVRRVFEMSGFDLIFPIFETEEVVIRAFRETETKGN